MPPLLTYATFFRRLCAGLIDFMLSAVATLAVGWVASQSKLLAFAVLPPLWFVALLYEPYLHAKFGGTIGKLAVGIRVVSTNGDTIGWRAALLRSSVSLAVSMYWYYCVASSVHSMQPDAFQGQGWSDLFELIKPNFPPDYKVAESVLGFWFWGEFATMLFNRKRRAIHDFLAGTVVVRLERSAA